MKQIFTFIIATFFCFGIANAQKNQGRRQEFSPEFFKKSLEMFVGREAGLSPDESKAFFPLLHEMLNAQREVENKQREVMMKANFDQKGFKDATEAEAQQAVTSVLDLEVKKAQIEQQYYKKFKKVLSWKKIMKVRQALYKFKMEALKNFRPQAPGAPRPQDGGQRNGQRRP